MALASILQVELPFHHWKIHAGSLSYNITYDHISQKQFNILQNPDTEITNILD
jgi:hypothetical protein